MMKFQRFCCISAVCGLLFPQVLSLLNASPITSIPNARSSQSCARRPRQRRAVSALAASFQSWISEESDWNVALDDILAKSCASSVWRSTSTIAAGAATAPASTAKSPNSNTSPEMREEQPTNDCQNSQLAFLFVSPVFGPSLSDIVQKLSPQLGKATKLVTVVAEGVIGSGQEQDDSTRPAMSLFMGTLPPGAEVDCYSVSSQDKPTWSKSMPSFGLPSKSRNRQQQQQQESPQNERPKSFVVFSDPHCSKLSQTLKALDSAGSVVVGGISARLSSGSKLPTVAIQDKVLEPGSLVALALGGSIGLQTIMAHGSHAFGETYTVTSIRGDAIAELNSKPALEQLEKEVEGAVEEDRDEIRKFGMLCGILQPETSNSIAERTPASASAEKVNLDTQGISDDTFLVRQVTGYRPQSGSILVAGNVQEGDLVRFHARDPSTALEDVNLMVQRAKAERLLLGQNMAGQMLGVLQISSVARGTSLFERKNVDHDHIRKFMEDFQEKSSPSGGALGNPLGGFFANGEIGSSGITMGMTKDLTESGNTYVHGFTCMAAVLCDYSAIDTLNNQKQDSQEQNQEGQMVTVGIVERDRKDCWG